MSNLPATKREHRGRAVGMIVEVDAVEIGPARLPVVRVPRELDRLVGLELDKLERAGADRMRGASAPAGRGTDRPATSPRRAAPATPAAAASGER